MIGLRLESLIAAWVLRQHPHFDVWLIAEKDPSTLWTNGHDRQCLVPHTESIGNLFRELKVNHSQFTSQDGILIRGRIEEYPKALVDLPRDYAERIVRDAFSKAEMEQGKPLKRKPRRLRCAADELVRALTSKARVLVAPSWQLEPGAVFVSGNRRFEYDFAIVTDPVWSLKHRVWFELPTVEPRERTVARITPRRLSPFRRWDTVFTPYTPAGTASRVVMRGYDSQIEMRGKADSGAVLSDLNFLFPDGYALQSVAVDEFAPRLLELAKWPENIVPLGPHAEGRAACTLDQVLDDAYSLMRKWTRTR